MRWTLFSAPSRTQQHLMDASRSEVSIQAHNRERQENPCIHKLSAPTSLTERADRESRALEAYRSLVSRAAARRRSFKHGVTGSKSAPRNRVTGSEFKEVQWPPIG
jgi:hypothetical protein